jgi:anthranilate synthase component 1
MSSGSKSSALAASPSLREFTRLAHEHSLVPVYRTVTADLETPVSAFLRIAADEPEAFLLESVEGGEHVGRYTFIGIEPYKKIVARGTSITIEEGRDRRTFEGDIFAELKQSLSGHTPARLPGLPPSPPAPSDSSATTSSARSSACPRWPRTNSACPMPA